MESDIVRVIVMIALFFLGRASGQASETGEWLDSVIEKKPIIRKGEIFIAKHIGGQQ